MWTSYSFVDLRQGSASDERPPLLDTAAANPRGPPARHSASGADRCLVLPRQCKTTGFEPAQDSFKIRDF